MPLNQSWSKNLHSLLMNHQHNNVGPLLTILSYASRLRLPDCWVPYLANTRLLFCKLLVVSKIKEKNLQMVTLLCAYHLLNFDIEVEAFPAWQVLNLLRVISKDDKNDIRGNWNTSQYHFRCKCVSWKKSLKLLFLSCFILNSESIWGNCITKYA